MEKQKKIVIIVLLIVIIVLLGIFLAYKIFNKSLLQPAVKEVLKEDPEKNLMDGRSAIDIATVEAKKWQPDAVLSYVKSDEVGQTKGKSNNWLLIFVSGNVKDKGFSVKVENFKVIETTEISYVGPAADFPANATTQAEAIAQVKTIPGYEDAKILGVDAVFGPGTKTWYWGIKTDKGTVSVKIR